MGGSFTTGLFGLSSPALQGFEAVTVGVARFVIVDDNPQQLFISRAGANRF